MKTLLMALITLLMFVFSAEAQQVVNFDAYGYTDIEPDIQVVPLAGGDTLYMTRYYYHQVSDSPDWPPALLYCHSNQITRDGEQLFAAGTCTRRDADGDLQLFAWEWPVTDSGNARGTHRYTFGTGKYAGLKCVGEWQSSDTFADSFRRSAQL